MSQTQQIKPPKPDHTGELAGNRKVIRFAGRDSKDKPRWHYKCLLCGQQADKPATWDNLRAQERAGIKHCIKCQPSQVEVIPNGTLCRNLKVTGPCFVDKTTATPAYPHGQRFVPTRCLLCGKEEDKGKTNFLAGKANCSCERDVVLGQTRKPLGRMLHASQARSRAEGWETDLTIEYLLEMGIPDECPCLGIPLNKEIQKRSDNSPALDRIDNSKGYIKGNVWIISDRANRLKNDSTPEELMTIANAVLKRLSE